MHLPPPPRPLSSRSRAALRVLAWLGSGAALAAAPAAPPLPAAEEPPVQLSRVEVVARPLAGLPEADRFGAVSTTVGEAQLEDLKALDFASALRRTPGVTLTRYNQVGAFGGGEGGAVFLRGLGSSRPGGEIKTLVDGVPKLNGIFNHPLLDLMPVDSAASIGVHPRATPLEFGNTFAAVNVVTPRLAGPGRLLRATLAAGSFGTVVERLDAGYREGAFDTYLSQSLRRSDGHRPEAGGRLENYFLRLGWELAPHWRLDYEVNRTRNEATDPGATTGAAGTASTRGEVYQTADWLQLAVLSHQHAGAEGSLRVYRNDGQGDWLRREYSGNADSLNDWRLSGLRWRELLRPWEGGEILVGADLDYDRGRSASVPRAPAAPVVFGPDTMRLFSAYAGMNHTLVRGGVALTPSAGVRYYRHDTLGERWAPQAGLVVAAGATRWVAGYSRAVNHPGLEVRALSQFIPALGTSWTTLRPETAGQFELGVRRNIRPGLAAALTLFRNEVRDRYVIAFPPPPPPRYVNLGAYRTEGAELVGEATLGESVAGFAGLAYLRTVPGGLPYAPRFTGTAGLNWRPAPRWLLSADGTYTSGMHVFSQGRSVGAANLQTVGAIVLVNARLARRLAWGPGQARHGELYLALENLTDRKYAYTPGYPMPGMNWMLGFRLEQ